VLHTHEYLEPGNRADYKSTNQNLCSV